MSNVPRLRFREFSGDWESRKFKDIIKETRLGGNYANTESKTNYPLIKMGNIARGKIDLNKIEYIAEREKLDNNDILKHGDLLFNTRNTLDLVGKVSVWKNELDLAFYNSNLMKLTFDEKFICNNYFMNYLFNTRTVLSRLKAIATGTTSVAAIYTRDLENIRLDYPCLEEQEKIASFFSLIDEKICLQSEKVEVLKDYKKGMMQKIFSRELRFKDDEGRDYPEWEEKKLSELVIFTNGKAHENCIDEFGEYIVVNSKFISSDGNIKKLSNENLCPLKKNDIVLVMSDVPNGKALAKCYLIDKDNKYTLNQRICGLRSKCDDPIFLYYFINRNKYYLKFDNGVGQTNLRKDEVLECPILLPCKEEQVKIGKILWNLDDKLKKEEDKLDSLNEYKKGLLQQMFV